MTLPCQPVVQIRLGTGANFGDVLVLGDLNQGILGTNVLGTTVVQVVDVSSTTQRISIRRGRDRIFEEYTPGQAIVQFQDFTGDWNPQNTMSPYYGKILPMRQIRISTEYSGTGYGLFTGFITSWDWSWPDQAADYALVTVYAIDSFRLLELSNITSVTGAANKDLPGERINLILDQIDWPDSLRAIDLGDTELQGDHGELRSALEAIQTIEQSDLGAFFIDANGYATYLSRFDLSIRAAGTAVVFDDDGTDVAYQDLDINLDETELANQVTFTRYGGTEQTVTDQASVDEYFLRSYDRSDLMMETNAIALLRAGQVLAYRKTPRLRIDSITLDVSSVSNRVVPALDLDIGDPIIVNRIMAAGTGFNLRITVNGITHDITPDRWTTTFTTAYPLTTVFILGSSEFGILGTNTL